MSEFDPSADSFEDYGTGHDAGDDAIVAQYPHASHRVVVDVNHGGGAGPAREVNSYASH
jgi:hypothetical protein